MFIKPSITRTDVLKIASLYRQNSNPVCTSLGGVPNSSFRVQDIDNDIVIKIYSKGHMTTCDILNSVEFIQHVSSNGINTLTLHKGTNGCILQNYRSFPVLCSTYIEGQNLSEVTWVNKILADVGKLLSDVIQAEKSCVLNSDKRVSLYGRLNYFLENNLVLSNPSIDKSFSSIREKLHDVLMHISEIELRYEQQICHMDIWPYNLILGKDNNLSLVDFDDWQQCCFLAELAACLLEFSMFESEEFNYSYYSIILSSFMSHYKKKIILEDLLWLMRYFCILWFGYNAVESSNINDALIYEQKLKTLYNPVVISRIIQQSIY